MIKTKESKFFDKNGANVVAYGDKIWEASTEGEGMHEFIIPLNIRVWKEFQTGLCWLLPLVNLETISKEAPVA